MKKTTAFAMLIPLLLCTACAGSDLNSDDSSVLSESNEAETCESVTESTTAEMTITDDDAQPADGIVQVDWEHTKVYTWKAFTRNGRIDDRADWTTETVFDIYGTFTITLAEFPDTEFIWRDSCLFVDENGEESGLEYCNRILNAFFTDLNSDGFPELCAFVSNGGGNGVDYIFVYDHHNRKKYTLQDWEEFNYALYAENDTLYVRKTPYSPDSRTETTIGQLAIKYNRLIMTEVMTEDTSDDASQSAADIVQVDWERTKVYTWKDFTIKGRKEKPDWLEDTNEFRGPFTISLAEFPDTVFMWWDGRLSAYENGEETVLVYLSSLWNAFFTDLNDDGFPELCVFFSGGSGVSCDYIAVYDYHNQADYILIDWMESDYSLYAEDDVLYVRKTPYLLDSGIETTIGHLAIENDALVMKE